MVAQIIQQELFKISLQFLKPTNLTTDSITADHGYVHA